MKKKPICHHEQVNNLLCGKLVSEHVTAIHEAGGIIVLATTRGIIIQENKSLLAENGGPFTTDISWAS